MIRLTLALITCSVFGGCMTQADQALWAEAKQTLSNKDESVAEKPAEAPDIQDAKTELKTTQDDDDSKVKAARPN